jgi:PKD repeat protein
MTLRNGRRLKSQWNKYSFQYRTDTFSASSDQMWRDWFFSEAVPKTIQGKSTVKIQKSISGKYTIGVPVCDFSASPLDPIAGQIVRFTDLSSGADAWWWYWKSPGSNEWGYFSWSQNPTLGLTEGSWGFRLIIVNQYGSDYEIKENYVTVTAPAVCTAVEPSSAGLNEEVHLHITGVNFWDGMFIQLTDHYYHSFLWGYNIVVESPTSAYCDIFTDNVAKKYFVWLPASVSSTYLFETLSGEKGVAEQWVDGTPISPHREITEWIDGKPWIVYEGVVIKEITGAYDVGKRPHEWIDGISATVDNSLIEWIDGVPYLVINDERVQGFVSVNLSSLYNVGTRPHEWIDGRYEAIGDVIEWIDGSPYLVISGSASVGVSITGGYSIILKKEILGISTACLIKTLDGLYSVIKQGVVTQSIQGDYSITLKTGIIGEYSVNLISAITGEFDVFLAHSIGGKYCLIAEKEIKSYFDVFFARDFVGKYSILLPHGITGKYTVKIVDAVEGKFDIFLSTDITGKYSLITIATIEGIYTIWCGRKLRGRYSVWVLNQTYDLYCTLVPEDALDCSLSPSRSLICPFIPAIALSCGINEGVTLDCHLDTPKTTSLGCWMKKQD